jgi:hypothetical protein
MEKEGEGERRKVVKEMHRNSTHLYIPFSLSMLATRVARRLDEP